MNKVFLIGNLTRDPELAETANKVTLCRFSIAVNRNYKGSDGERKTDFFNCVAWRGLGENVAKYVKKGDRVAVSGSIELRNYEDNQGIKRTGIDIICQEVEFVLTRSEDNDKPQLTPTDDSTDIPF